MYTYTSNKQICHAFVHLHVGHVHCKPGLYFMNFRFGPLEDTQHTVMLDGNTIHTARDVHLSIGNPLESARQPKVKNGFLFHKYIHVHVHNKQKRQSIA